MWRWQIVRCMTHLLSSGCILDIALKLITFSKSDSFSFSLRRHCFYHSAEHNHHLQPMSLPDSTFSTTHSASASNRRHYIELDPQPTHPPWTKSAAHMQPPSLTNAIIVFEQATVSHCRHQISVCKSHCCRSGIQPTTTTVASHGLVAYETSLQAFEKEKWRNFGWGMNDSLQWRKGWG